MQIADRAQRIEPFYVMEVAKAASALAREVADSSRPMVFLNIGEPDFTAPPLVQEAADRAVRNGATQYTPALGLDALRERISDWYAQRFGVNVPARRIVVTAGASAALQLACLALINAGDEVLMPDPSYPCNRHFVSAAEFKGRRDYFIPALNSLGLSVPVMPDGAFYAWADCSQVCSKLGISGSWDFAFEVMRQAHVAITPGRDFGVDQTASFVRFSTASSMAQLQESVARLRGMLG